MVQDGNGYREWLVPAAFVNRYPVGAETLAPPRL
jgi:hypothetical protein